jgi:hypothetical protein
MDLAGAVADIGNLPLQGIDYLVNQIRGTDQNYISTDRPFGGSAQLIDAATRLGLSQQPTGSAPETIGRVMAGLINPMAGARAVGRVGDITTEQANRAADALVRQITGNPQATAPQVLQETSMPFMQAVAPRPSGLLETPVKSDLGFYSALEQATIPLQNKGTGSQFLAQIEKTAGVKPEEVKWTGLDEFLKSRQNVTKQEVQEFLDKNRVEIKEVALSNETATYSGELPKFSSYTLPGGENYREILLTLPQKGGDEVKIAEQNMYVLAKQTADLMEEWKGLSEQMPGDPRVVNLYQQLAETRRMRDQAVVDARELRKASEAETYRSSHFDQPNILAHMRVNDRVVDGKKTLFIEEVQSDWHQAGRKKGYGPQTETTHEAYYTTPDGQRVSLGFGATQEEAAAAVDSGWKNIVDVKFDTQTRKVSEGVPDAPFKTTWHELSLKRAIQEASEKGYDQIAFTTGKTQAERYSLSKQIDAVKATKQPDGLYSIEAYKDDAALGRGRNPLIERQNLTAEQLEDTIGKELAKKIVTDVSGNQTSKTYSGVDLDLGGEGMKGFYDQILPKSLEKLGKKFNAKVGKTALEPTLSKDELAAQVYGRGETYKNLPSESKRKIDQMYMGKGTEVWTMDITPKMRESVLTKGQPLFAATPALPALGLLGSEEE